MSDSTTSASTNGRSIKKKDHPVAAVFTGGTLLQESIKMKNSDDAATTDAVEQPVEEDDVPTTTTTTSNTEDAYDDHAIKEDEEEASEDATMEDSSDGARTSATDDAQLPSSARAATPTAASNKAAATAEGNHAAASANATNKEQPQPPQYSTRGRNASRETDQDLLADRLLDRAASSSTSRYHPLADDILLDPAAAVLTEQRVSKESTVSFLDSLGEEERRTRTRFLPDVDGIHVLFKSEIKQDLALARTAMYRAGVSSTLRKNGGRSRNNTTAVATSNTADAADRGEEDEEDVTPEDMSSDGGTGGATINYVDATSSSNNVTLRAFVAPSEEQLNCDMSTANINNNGTASDSDDGALLPTSSPHVIEVVNAFDPPRPPESVGPKKKHRLMRWERRPQDVQVDLDSYRKTVTRTRKELHNAQAERERIDAVSAHLRAHFLCHLSALEIEGSTLDEELANIQLECVKAADLLQSRTRSRGAGKGSYVMKDVLNILKQKGAEIASTSATPADAGAGIATSGIGGVSSKSFKEWERGDPLQWDKPSNGWILPGSLVETPYGKGQVISVFEPSDLNVNAVPVTTTMLPKQKKPLKNAYHGFGSAAATSDSKNGITMEESSNVSKKKKKKEKEFFSLQPHIKIPTKMSHLLAPRICVKLPFGVGFFAPEVCTAHEDVSIYSDAQLAARWIKMTESALAMAGSIDFAALAHVAADGGNTSKRHDITSDDDDDDDDDEALTDNSHDETLLIPKTDDRFLPFGANMLPTSCGRGARLCDAPLTFLEQEIHFGLFKNEKILGCVENRGVPQKFREWEDIRDELSILRAQVLHRRNQLARQRRIRAHNERALATTLTKSGKAELLVSEMRADLKSLKDRLDHELVELGIDRDRAETLLAAHYYNETTDKHQDDDDDHHHYDDHHDAPPAKRARQ